MNYARATAVAGTTLGLFLVALVLLLWDDKPPAPAAPSVIAVNRLEVGDIAAVAVNNTQGAYGFILAADGAIQLVAEPEIAQARYALNEMQAFVFELSKLSAARSISDPGNLQQYGLDPALARITIVRKDGEKLRLFLGAATPPGDQYYLRKDGDPSVYLIGKSQAERMLRARTDYWDRQLLPRIDAQSVDRLESVQLTAAAQPQNSWRLAPVGNGSFRMTQPVAVSLRADTVFAQLLRPLSELRADRFVALAGNLEGSALLTPTHRLDLVFAGQQHTLLFAPDGQGGSLVRRADGAAVFSLSPDNAAFLSTSYRDLVGEFMYNASMADLQSVTLQRQNERRPFLLTMHGSGLEMVGITEGRSVPAAQLAQSLAPLLAIGIVGEVASTAQARVQVQEAVARPALTQVVIRKRDGSQDDIAFFPFDDQRSFVRINGAVDFISYTSAAQAIAQSLRSLQDGGTAAETSPRK